MRKSSKPASPRISPLFQKMMRNAFRVEPLEERILLSADPVGALAQTVVWSAPALDDEGFATHPSGSASTGDVSLRQGQIPLSTAMDDAFFSVDGLAFDQALTQTRSAFMESALALSDADYARFMDGVLSTPTGPSLGLGGVSVDLASTVSYIDLVLARAGKDAGMRADGPGQPHDVSLAEGRFDVTDLAQAMRSVNVSALLLHPRASRGGSCAMSAHVVPNGPLAAEQGTPWRPVRGGGALAAVAIPQPGAQSLILLEFSARERARINEPLIRALLVADVPVASEHAVVQPASGGDEWVMLMDIVARVMREKQFGAAALQLVNLLAATLRCEQVALGWREHGITKVLAISHLDRFEDKTEVIQLLESALEEAADQRVDIDYPQTGEGNTVTLAHERLQRRVGFGSMTTLVMGPDGDEDEPVLTLLLARESRLQERQLHGVSVVCHLLRPWLLEQQERSRWAGRRWLRRSQQLARLAFNPKSPVRNITAGVLVLLLAFVLFGSWPYRIEASGELATDSVQLISAPFDGFLATTSKSLGDPVEEGEVMARLDVRDLQLQIADLQSELQRNLAEGDRARALDQIADTAVAQARAEQAAARLDRARFQLSQSEIRAPFAGVVVEGDRKELAGTPVRQGDKLFRMARSEDLYAVIHVSERDIRDVPENAQWRLRLLGQPNLQIPFEIANIVPVAKVVNGQGNRFPVRVALQSPPESWWRPGMSGLALIDAGSRPVIWIRTHKAIDTVRLWLWW